MALGYFDANASPEQVLQRKRELDYLANRMGGAQNVGQGIGDMLTGLAVGIGRNGANKAESAGWAGGDKLFNAFMSSYGGAKSASQAPQVSGGAAFPNPALVATPEAKTVLPGGMRPPGEPAMMAQADAAVKRPSMPEVPQGPSSWLQYDNAGATRNKPLNPKLEQSLAFLGDMGVQMKVFSGGQDAAGSGGKRTGSTRHDHGNAADVFFIKDGKQLDWRNPADIPVLQQIVSRAKSNGVTGFGAGDGYMQPGSMHIGLGTPAVWGAGGKGSNAPSWLRDAFEGRVKVASNDTTFTPASAPPADVSYETPQPPMQPQMADNAQPSSRMNELMQLMTNPWLDDSKKAVVQSLLQQEMQRADPAYQMKMQGDQLGLEKQQLELEQMRNPPPPKPIEVGGRLLDARTFKPVYEPPVTPEYDFINGKDGSVFLGDKTSGTLKTLYGGQSEPIKPTADIQNFEYSQKNPAFSGYLEKSKQPLVNIDQKAESAFDKKLAEGQAETFNTMATDGMNARADIGLINQLEGLIQGQGGMGTGLAVAAGKWGIPVTEGMSDLQAADAIISKLVPTQRQPGSGSMSDRDVELFKSSLPSLWNQPGGNQIIIQTMRGLAQYKQAQGEISQQVQMGSLSRQDAVRALKALPNPLADFGKKKPAVDTMKAPEGWGEEWQFLTPEERANVQKLMGGSK